MKSGIVTPEGVVLDFAPGGIASRLLARLIDSMAVAGLIYLVAIPAMVLAVSAPTLSIVIMIVSVFLGLFVYPALLEAMWGGRTVGKYALGLRVVTVEGGPVRFRHAAIRSMLQLIDIFATLGGAAVLAAMLSRSGQRLGDMAAGTLVVRDRGTRSGVSIADREVVIPTPWQMQPLVDSIDASQLNQAQAALVRSFIVRVPELSMESRASLAHELAARASAVIGTPIPDELHPEVWLACVAARVQQQAVESARSSLPPPPRIPPPSAHR